MSTEAHLKRDMTVLKLPSEKKGDSQDLGDARTRVAPKASDLFLGHCLNCTSALTTCSLFLFQNFRSWRERI